MNLILIAVISLGAIGLISAVILFVASKKFAVYEDPRIAQVAEVLPQANCGGCGYPGCSGFADACVKAGSLEGKLCPVGGQPVMAKVAAILGLEAGTAEPMVAVVRCNGSCEHRPWGTGVERDRPLVPLYGLDAVPEAPAGRAEPHKSWRALCRYDGGTSHTH